MPARNSTLKSHLAGDSEIDITVKGRSSGSNHSFPIWFVFDSDTLYLLPVHGSDTQWYKNVLRNPVIQINAGGVQTEISMSALTDLEQVKPVIERFRDKYGDSGIRLYSKLNVAVVGRVD